MIDLEKMMELQTEANVILNDIGIIINRRIDGEWFSTEDFKSLRNAYEELEKLNTALEAEQNNLK